MSPSTLLARSFSSLRTVPRAARLYSTPAKPSVKLIAELRKQSDVSLPLAREALAASNLSIPGALEWLAKHGDKKASKVAGRATNEGLVGVYTISEGVGKLMRAPVWAGMVEMNCETDFVARGNLFGKLLSEVAHSAAFHAEAIRTRAQPKKGAVEVEGGELITSLDVDQLMKAPLMSYSNPDPTGKPLPTVEQSLRTLMGKVGENISIRRAAVVQRDIVALKDIGLRLGAYGHGGTYTQPKFCSGRIASMAVLALKAPLGKDPRASICDWFRRESFQKRHGRARSSGSQTNCRIPYDQHCIECRG